MESFPVSLYPSHKSLYRNLLTYHRPWARPLSPFSTPQLKISCCRFDTPRHVPRPCRPCFPTLNSPPPSVSPSISCFLSTPSTSRPPSHPRPTSPAAAFCPPPSSSSS